MKRLINWIDRKIENWFLRIQKSTEVPEWHSSIFRIFFGTYILVFMTPFFGWLGLVPQNFFNPPVLSMPKLYGSFPPAIFFNTVDILIVLTAIMLTLGIKSRLSGLVLFTLVIVGLSFQYSFGKIDHNILSFVTLLCFSFSNWGSVNALIPDVRLKFHSKVPGMLAILLVFAMFTAGLEKSLIWIDFDLNTSGFLSWFYSGYYTLGRQFVFADLVFKIPSFVLEFMDYFAVVFELSGIVFLLVGARAWKLWLLTACVFHAANVCLLNIPFHGNVIVYISFFLFPLLNESKLKENRGFKLLIKAMFALCLIYGVLRIYYRLSGNRPEFMMMPKELVSTELVLYICLFLWLAMSGFGLISVISERRPKHVSGRDAE